MKNRKTKNALVLSAIALCLCFMMFVGTTYAWFTDSVASEGNVIKTGTLNIDLQVLDGADYKSIKTTAEPVFNYDKWEPGYTSWANVKVVTTGTLALKYTMKIVASGNATELADVIDVYYAPTQVAKPATRDLSGLTKIGTLADALAGTIVINDTLIPGANEADFATLALKMQETAGNEYQDKTVGGTFSLQIIATQYTYEEDSFGPDYDTDADFPGTALVGTAAAYTAALADPAVEEVKLAEDVTISGPQTISGKTVNGNGNTITVSNTGSDCGLNAKSGTIENVTVTGAGRGIGTGSSGTYGMDGDLYLNNVTVDGPVYGINIGKGNGYKVYGTNSTILGWNSIAGAEATFTGCTFGKGTTGGAANYNVWAIYNTITFENCAFDDGFAFFGRAASTGTITLTNCTWGGTAVTAANFAACFNSVNDSDFNYLVNNCTIIIDGETYVPAP